MKTLNRKTAAWISLITLWQVIMVACLTFVDATPSHHWFLSAVVIAAWLLPFIGYLVASYGTSLLADLPKVLRAGVFVISSLVSTFAGYLVLLQVGGFIRELIYHGKIYHVA